MRPYVKCVVDTCTHYLLDNRCGAGNIDIMHEAETKMSEIVDQTMCKTYTHARNLNSYLGSADNVNWTGALIGLLNPDYEVTPTVACTVSSCKYWGEGAICVAEAIEVNGSAPFNECQDTNCITFERRGSE
ncbi:DUF1540 domain-containing protein [Ammoniphilus resinae]|uniref:DUF1540 domain-containing protein n=1 Tax=Ammoniphilus resinae TaxID=861532 RepID=A0ABS4GVN2_9BACL|nr:DUF1540 domain-containing protein [Ammoniphilus resinae]MBP1934329.1 hypothetical protein [Ammoniphilus resinae]